MHLIQKFTTQLYFSHFLCLFFSSHLILHVLFLPKIMHSTYVCVRAVNQGSTIVFIDVKLKNTIQSYYGICMAITNYIVLINASHSISMIKRDDCLK